jgi:hypothetical protein
MPSKPIQAYKRKEDGKIVIVDGHHRFFAAKSLGIPFYYVLEDDACQNAMPDVNRSRPWKVEDFVRQFAIRGIKDFAILQSYANRGLSCSVAASLLSGETAGSNNHNNKIRNGTFKIKSTKNADQILSLIEDNPTIDTFRHSSFIKALSMCQWLPEFDFGTFKSRVEANWHMLPKCSNVDDFLRHIEEVYNYRSHIKHPIAHLAKRLSSERKSKFGK